MDNIKFRILILIIKSIFIILFMIKSIFLLNLRDHERLKAKKKKKLKEDLDPKKNYIISYFNHFCWTPNDVDITIQSFQKNNFLVQPKFFLLLHAHADR